MESHVAARTSSPIYICPCILSIAQFPAQPEVLINLETAGNIFLKLSPDLHMIVLLTQFIILITKNNFLCHFQGKPSGGSVHLLSN